MATTKFDEKQAFALQERYLKTRSQEDLSQLIECIRIGAAVAVKHLVKTKGLRLPSQRIEELANDTAHRFIEQYLKHPDYQISRSFMERLKSEARYFLFDARLNRYEMHNVSLGAKHERRAANTSDQASSNGYSRRSIQHNAAELQRFKGWVERLRKAYGKQWVYKNAASLPGMFQRYQLRKPNATRKRSQRAVTFTTSETRAKLERGAALRGISVSSEINRILEENAESVPVISQGPQQPGTSAGKP